MCDILLSTYQLSLFVLSAFLITGSVSLRYRTADRIANEEIRGRSWQAAHPESRSLNSAPSRGRPKAATADQCWPKENFALLQPPGGCPEQNWGTGSITHTLRRNSTVPTDLVSGVVHGVHLTLDFCAHDANQSCLGTPTPTFPAGAYCIYQYSGIVTSRETSSHLLNHLCPPGFKWSWLAIDDVNLRNKNAHNGQLPQGEFFSFSTVQYFCCREDGDANQEIVLPTKKDFILFPMNSTGLCQKVKGMTAIKSQIFYDTSDDSSKANGPPSEPDFPPPQYSVDVPKDYWGQGLRVSICYYTSQGGSSGGPVVPPTCWPNEDFALFQSAKGCPSGDPWSPGYVQHTEGHNSKVPAQIKGSVTPGGLILGYCSHDAETQTTESSPNAAGRCTASNTATFQPGSYCVFVGYINSTNIFDKSCPQDFAYNWFVIDDVDANNHNAKNGTVPEGEYYDFSTVYYACCRDDGFPSTPISLPNKEAFVLMPSETDRKCQAVIGMNYEYLDVFFDSELIESNLIPLPPQPTIQLDYVIDQPKDQWGAGMHIKVCHYTPIA
ncbi:hypothetical protein BV898_00363 [Hypsibius exemplaris]|uniref:Apextrin C-terminal domain-containing protein n=1 Tax=Hypsibius exemplaris TaxID=2072580 RepID=A0A1W0XFQ3_HYPEX|nr:hypothetical protein BV898_00363 [Hypsibius exemplaris]